MLKTNQEPDYLLTDTQLDAWLSGYTDEEIEEVAEMWQQYAGKRYKNIVVSVEDASTP